MHQIIYNQDSYATQLANLMSNISEDHYAAGWLRDNEYNLWAIMTEAIRPFYGLSDVSLQNIRELWDLHLASGGWVIWDEAISNEMFVTTEEWLPIYEKWAKGHTIRWLSDQEVEQLNAEQQHRASGISIFDFEAREKAAEEFRAKKGWARLPPFYWP